tara:strand:- start:306 stop:509 length:204 start_codon:yes stop_codon:yes gene_type:complete
MPYDPQRKRPLYDSRLRSNVNVAVFAIQLALVVLMVILARPGVVSAVIAVPLGLLFLWKLITELQKP